MSALTIAEVLNRAADLLEKPGAWTQKTFARNAAGHATGLTEFFGPAVCWCALGAIEKVAGDDARAAETAGDFLRVILPDSIGTWNDAPERTQSEVVAALRKAAALAATPARPMSEGE